MMKNTLSRWTLITLAGAALAGCDKKETPPAGSDGVALVAPSARSKSFQATMAHLDLGGPVFAYAETEGDPKRVADALLKLYAMGAEMSPLAPKPPASVDPFLKDLGLDNIHATGFSSRRDGDAFVNRTFLYTPGGPSGLATIFGSKNAPFASPALAPANALLVAEGELDAERLVSVLRAVAGHIGDGKQASAALEKALTEPIPNTPFTADRLVKHATGRAFIGIQASVSERIPAGKATLSAPDLVLALDGREALFNEFSALVGMAGKNAPVKRTEDAAFVVYTLGVPAPGAYARYAPVVAMEKATKRLWIATNRATLDAWTSPAGDKLAKSAEFMRLSSGLSASGTGFCYVSPSAEAPLREWLAAVAANMPEEKPGEARMVSEIYGDVIGSLFPKGASGLYGVSFVTPDGLAGESRSPLSEKPNAYLWACRGSAVPVAVVGTLAATAVPAFKKVRNNALEKTLRNDARQISSAAQQYMSENAKSSCKVSDLRMFFQGGRISSGNRIGPATEHPAFARLLDFTSSEGGAIELKSGGRFVLGNADYDRSLSSMAQIRQAPGDKNSITFEVDTGMVSQ